MRFINLGIVLILGISINCFAEEDSLSFATYYPAPYGNYKEMRAMRMAIGDNYIKTSDYNWEAGATNLIDSSADLIVEGNVGIGKNNPTAKLDVNGNIHASGDLCTDQVGGKCLSNSVTSFITVNSGYSSCNNSCASQGRQCVAAFLRDMSFTDTGVDLLRSIDSCNGTGSPGAYTHDCICF